MTNNELTSTFRPSDHETRIYKLWEKHQAFQPTGKGQPFTVIMPPPNANGSLHLGHALSFSLQDIIVRFERMRGRKTLYLPGADHAGFETQVVFEQELEKQKKTRFDLSREELYQEIWEFTREHRGGMRDQLKRLGISANWSKEKFTLDKDVVAFVHETFEQLKNDGLIYRGLKIVNWCPKHQTTLSDLEISWETRNDPLYYIRYGPLTLATVRPETKFGDTAIAVHPDDPRYQHYIGNELEIEDVLGKVKIKVIPNAAVDREFGTGVIKVTPAHDPLDFEIGERHKLEVRQVIGFDGRLNDHAGEFQGLPVTEARRAVVKRLREKGLLEKIDETYEHRVARCYKCGTPIEPLPRESWFVAMDKRPQSGGPSLKERGLKALDEITLLPERYIGVYRHWLEHIKDWPISRQIVWGIAIPDTPEETFDTWFSSGQWPVVTLKTTDAFDDFYPTSVLATGHEILFFWVTRMLMLGHYLTGKYPFQTVYLHGLVRDKDRQKMSKSKGNVIDPLGVIDDYGVDALRLALVFGVGIGTDIAISEEKIAGMRNFANKIWNISRFILMNRDAASVSSAGKPPRFGVVTSEVGEAEVSPAAETKADREILEKLEETIRSVTKDMEQFKFHEAAEKLYQFVWHEFADTYIETSKQSRNDTVLLYTLVTSLKLLHPFMPFVTESIWQELHSRQLVEEPLLIAASWPVAKEKGTNKRPR